MGQLKKDTFICLDVESTGLDTDNDRIIEIAAVKFSGDQVLDTFETLIDPEMTIPEESIAIHHITQDMCAGKPKIKDILKKLFDFIGTHIIVGHGIPFDLNIITSESRRNSVKNSLDTHTYIDTLRLARLYGESPTNSLEVLRQHFNIPSEGAHRAMNDVVVNIDVFKYLTTTFKTTEDILNRLKHPICFRTWPLGKYKGRVLSEMPRAYLDWALHKDFDQDLLYTIRTELKQRKKGSSFSQKTNPFSGL